MNFLLYYLLNKCSIFSNTILFIKILLVFKLCLKISGFYLKKLSNIIS